MRKIIRFAASFGMAIFGTFCVVRCLLEHDALWAIAAGVVWLAVTQMRDYGLQNVR